VEQGVPSAAESRTQGPVQTILEVERALVLDHVGEQAAGQVAGSSAAASTSSDSSERRPSPRISRHQPMIPTSPKSSHCTE
jgi:hypothetical protein